MASHSKVITALATAAASTVLAVSASPASAASAYWANGINYSDYVNERWARSETNGAVVGGEIHWNRTGTSVGINATVYDTQADGYGAIANVGYYADGDRNRWTVEEIGHASGGDGSRATIQKHSIRKVTYIKIQACKVKGSTKICGPFQ
ncbi:hypothetical protein ACQEVY_00745 [Streptomyces sp. CA-288835]|uniref:hypothetical protein n=1 Tax=Streptomyces sp. CA-288835 TaxID=3240069 RepID=UPI003D8CCAF5